MERVANFLTILITAAVFCTKSLAYALPVRGMDRLRLALLCEAATIAYLFTAGLLRLCGVLPTHAPHWEAWAVRVCLIVFGIGVLVEMARAGAVFPRRTKQ